jgi:DNA-binding MarR family transcriptional regulator
MNPKKRMSSDKDGAPDFPAGALEIMGFLLNRPAFHLHDITRNALRPLGLIPPDLGILSNLDSSGPQSQRVLGDRLKIDRTTMVGRIDELEKHGLVKRESHPKDRRAYFITLCPAGKKALAQSMRLIREIDERFLVPLTKAEQEILKKLLTKLVLSIATAKIPREAFKKK